MQRDRIVHILGVSLVLLSAIASIVKLSHDHFADVYIPHPACRDSLIQTIFGSQYSCNTFAWPQSRIRPRVFIIGEQKCGTTSLYRYLSLHPFVISSRFKELCFFSDQVLQWRPFLGPYEDTLKDKRYTLTGRLSTDFRSGYVPMYPFASSARVHDHAMNGLPFLIPTTSVDWKHENVSDHFHGVEACPFYLHDMSAAVKLSAVFPDAQLIVLIRDPIDRFISAFRHFFSREEKPYKFLQRHAQGRANVNEYIHYTLRNYGPYMRAFEAFQSACSFAKDMRKAKSNVHSASLPDDISRDSKTILECSLIESTCEANERKNWTHCRKFYENRNSVLRNAAFGFMNLGNTSSLFRRGLYFEHLNNWVKRFPETQVHVIFSEDLFSYPMSAMKELELFLGVPSYLNYNDYAAGHDLHMSFNNATAHVSYFRSKHGVTQFDKLAPFFRSVLQALYIPRVEMLFSKYKGLSGRSPQSVWPSLYFKVAAKSTDGQ